MFINKAKIAERVCEKNVAFRKKIWDLSSGSSPMHPACRAV